MILGYEIMGKLIEVGEEAEKNGFNVGDRVIALNQGLYGGLAEKCVVNMEVSHHSAYPSIIWDLSI